MYITDKKHAGNRTAHSCSVCNKTVYVWPSRVKHQEYHYCSIRCREFMAAKRAAAKRVMVSCGFCQKTIEILKNKVERYKSFYCSKGCQHKGQVKEKIQINCDYCGLAYGKYPSNFENGSKLKFCSKPCHDSHNFETRSKQADCVCCGRKLKSGEGWMGEQKKHKDYLCDSCRAKRGALVELEKIKVKRLAIESIREELDDRLDHIKTKPACYFCGKALSFRRRHKLKSYCSQPCKAKHDPKMIINARMRKAMNKCLRNGKGGKSWKKILGYTVDDLAKHLEALFVDGMSWDNIGAWHIDHVIPKKLFNYTSYNDPDFKKCWALKNLQPLWAADNLRKSARYDKPFQPSLSMG